MADGDDCKCCACCIGYCSCGADWTSQEVYDLRSKVSQLQAEVARLTDNNEQLAKMHDEQSTLTDKVEAERDAMQEIVKAVAMIGVNFGYGEYQLESKHIKAARALTVDKLHSSC